MSICICSFHLHIKTAKCMDYLKPRNTQRADIIHTCKKRKEKSHRTSATIWLNRICRLNHLTPDYIKITADIHNQQCYNTKKAATTYRINKITQFYLHFIF